MNELTHFLTGYLIARLLFKRKNDQFECFFIAFAALIPDFDSFLHLFIPIESLEHAIFTHTIIGGVLLTLIYTSVIWLIGKKFIKNLGINYQRLLFLAIIGLASHLVLDIFTYRQDIATTSAHLYFWPISDFSWHLNGFFPDIAYMTRILIEVIYTAIIGAYILFFQWAYKKESPISMLFPKNWLDYLSDTSRIEDLKKPAMAILILNFGIIILMAISLFV